MAENTDHWWDKWPQTAWAIIVSGGATIIILLVFGLWFGKGLGLWGWPQGIAVSETVVAATALYNAYRAHEKPSTPIEPAALAGAGLALIITLPPLAAAFAPQWFSASPPGTDYVKVIQTFVEAGGTALIAIFIRARVKVPKTKDMRRTSP